MNLSTLFDSPVALGATLAVVGTIVVFVYLIIKLLKLMNTTHSED